MSILRTYFGRRVVLTLEQRIYYYLLEMWVVDYGITRTDRNCEYMPAGNTIGEMMERSLPWVPHNIKHVTGAN